MLEGSRAIYSPTLTKTGEQLVNFLKKKKHLISLWSFLKTHVHPDFYLTKDNRRLFITQLKDFKQLLSQSNNVFVHDDVGEINGIVMIWAGSGGDTKRRYVKINASDARVADRLLTVLLWHTNTDLYVKIKKGSPFIDVFRGKNFRFAHGRGKEVLLIYKHRERKYGNNPIRHNYKNKVFTR